MFSFLKRLIRKQRPLWRKLAGDNAISLDEYPDAPALFRMYRNLIATGHRRVPGGWIYEGEFYPDYLTVGGNTFAIRRTALKYCKGTGLDIGASYWPLPGSTPIDTELGPGTQNAIHDIQENSQDYVFSSHCLEHIENWQETLDIWIGKLKPEGILFLYLPHPSCKLWSMTNPQMNDIHKWVPNPDILKKTLQSKNMTIVDFNEGPDHFYSFYLVARK